MQELRKVANGLIRLFCLNDKSLVECQVLDEFDFLQIRNFHIIILSFIAQCEPNTRLVNIQKKIWKGITIVCWHLWLLALTGRLPDVLSNRGAASPGKLIVRIKTPNQRGCTSRCLFGLSNQVNLILDNLITMDQPVLRLSILTSLMVNDKKF